MDQVWIKKRGSGVDQTSRVDHAWIKISKTWISVDQKKTWIKCGSKIFSAKLKEKFSQKIFYPFNFETWIKRGSKVCNVDHCGSNKNVDQRGSIKTWIKCGSKKTWIKKFRCGSKVPRYSQLCCAP